MRGEIMKIAMVFDGLPIGGIERVGASYAQMFLKLGYDVTVINIDPKRKAMAQELPKECAYGEVRFPHWLAPERYAQLIKRFPVGRYAYPCLYTVVWLLDAVYRICCHSISVLKPEYDLAIAFSGHYNDLTFVADRFVKAKNKMAWLHGNVMGYTLISDGFLNLYNKIKNLIVLNEDYQGEVLLRNRNLHLNIHKVYNPSYIKASAIDEEAAAKLRMEYGDFLMMIGRLDGDKDQLTLIQALEHIKKKYRFSEKLLLIGDGMKRDELEAYVRTHALENQMLFMGSRYDVQNWYKAAYLFVHSSPAEGLSTTLIEALAFQVPIVATNSMPGVGEILEGGKYGEIVPVGDWEQLGEAIYKMYRDKELYAHYKQLAGKRADDFMPDTVQNKIQNILQELIC